MALQEAITSKNFEGAKELVADSANFGLSEAVLTPEEYPLTAGELTGVALLKLWEKFQADKLPPADEEAEAKDVTSEEYIAELAAELTGQGVPEADAGYIVKALTTVGFYFGGRGAAAVGETGDKEYDLLQGLKSGYGLCLLPSGDVYAGEYVDGSREGVGVLKTAAGTVYAGAWAKGKRHGKGSMTYADGGSYSGAWKFGKRCGTGTFTYASGDVYAGEWHAGQKHGSGKYSAKAAGCVYEGTWRYGTLVASKLVLESAAGAAFYGAFDKAGRPTGKGAFAFGNGVTLDGVYTAPPIEEAEGDEPPPVLPSVWAGGSCGAVDGTTDKTLSEALTTVKPVLNVIIAGAPASGKGTQCEKIVADYGLFHLSTGDMLRAAAEDPDNEIGQQAAAIMAEGGLVPDEIMLGLVTQKLNDPAIQEKGWLLDGFPRTAAQAAALDEYFLVPTKCVLIDVPEEVLVARVTGRRKDPETGTIYHMTTKPPYKLDEEGNPVVDEETGEKVMDEEILGRLEQRADDTEEALTKRLAAFGANRDAIATAFASIALTVDGNRPPDEVYADITKFLEA